MTEELFTELCTLLDAIEMELVQTENHEGALELLAGRFEMMECHGLTVEFGGLSSGASH